MDGGENKKKDKKKKHKTKRKKMKLVRHVRTLGCLSYECSS